MRPGFLPLGAFVSHFAGPLATRRVPGRVPPVALILALALVGCGDPDPIRQYTVAKQAPDESFITSPGTPAPREQPQQRQVAWFFKMLGPETAVAAQAEPFAKLIRSVEFGPGGQPKWTLPEGWTERTESGLRLATIEIPGETKLEISVMSLPAADPKSSEYLLSNLNRWRGQLGLEDIEGEQALKDARDRGEVQQFDAQGRKVTLVNLAGKTAEAGESRMLAAMIVPESGSTPATVASPSSDTNRPFTFTRPDNWREAPLRTFQLAAFTVGDSGSPLTISVSTAGGDITANVNRWRGQAGLPDLSASEITADARSISVDGVEAKYFVVDGAERAILGVIVPRAGTQWFIKADGPKALVDQERSRFDAFVKSIQFK